MFQEVQIQSQSDEKAYGVRPQIVTDAFRTSPRESLYVEANEQSLTDRREMLLLQYYIRINKIPDSIVVRHMKSTSLDIRYRNTRKKPKSVAYKLRQLCEKKNINIPKITPFYQCRLGPWEIIKPKICIELTIHGKSQTNPIAYQKYFHEHKHTAEIEIYTDGSKGELGVGAGVLVKNGEDMEENAQKLKDIASVFTAEMLAIEIGLKILRKYNNKRCVVYSDSLSALQAIRSANVDDKRIGVIYETLDKLRSQEVKVEFCWIPGHSDIKGNEIADSIAKRACILPTQDSHQEVSASDCKAYIRKKIKDSWEQRWRQLEDNKKLKSIQESVEKKVMKLSRIDEVKLTRLRIGHTRLTHSWILMGEDQPMCIECDVPLTIKHILMECGNNYLERMEYYDHREVNMKILLNSDEYIPKVLQFLKDINMYKEI